MPQRLDHCAPFGVLKVVDLSVVMDNVSGRPPENRTRDGSSTAQVNPLQRATGITGKNYLVQRNCSCSVPSRAGSVWAGQTRLLDALRSGRSSERIAADNRTSPQ
jgi:hypothetical protein